MAQIWFYPCMAIHAIQSSSREGAKNAINDVAWARVGFRISPRMDHKKFAPVFEAYLKKHAPEGFEITTKQICCYSGWELDISKSKNKQVLDLVCGALRKGFDQEPILMGIGAAIPMIKPLAEAYPNAVALTLGVGNPLSNAHGENESMPLEDFRKTVTSICYLMEEMGK